jgi:hypothetical protein
LRRRIRGSERKSGGEAQDCFKDPDGIKETGIDIEMIMDDLDFYFARA